jgi:hypothetical protein
MKLLPWSYGLPQLKWELGLSGPQKESLQSRSEMSNMSSVMKSSDLPSLERGASSRAAIGSPLVGSKLS